MKLTDLFEAVTDDERRKVYDCFDIDVDMWTPKFARLVGQAKAAGVLDDKPKLRKWLADKGMFGSKSDRLRAPGDKYYPRESIQLEDWGSSDWYPVMKSMARELKGIEHPTMAQLKDAAYNAGHFYKDSMGHEDTAQGDEDMIKDVMRHWISTSEETKKKFFAMHESAGRGIESFTGVSRKERLEKLYGKKAFAAVKYRQIGGDDGYQFHVLVNGRSIVGGLTRREADFHAQKEMDILAKRFKEGKYTPTEEVKEGKGPNAFSLLAAENKARKIKDREAEKTAEKERKKERAARSKKPEKMSSEAIYHKALDFAGRGFPDVDPIEYLTPWMNKNDLTMDDVDKAMRKHGEKGGWNGYLIGMWDQFADQAMHDAQLDLKKGRTPEMHHLTFFNYDKKTGKLTKRPNPWK